MFSARDSRHFAAPLVEWIRPIPFRGKVRLVGRLIPAHGMARAVVHASEFELKLDNYIDRMIFLGCYEPLNTRRFKRILGPGMTAVDVGANIGYYSLLAANLVGKSGKVISVEPFPENYRRLTEHVTRNGLAGIVFPQQYALGDSPGTGTLVMSTLPGQASNGTLMESEGGVSTPVETRNLDSCIESWGVGYIDLLKIDVEGFESKVLAGARKTLAEKRVKNILLEFDNYHLGKAGHTEESFARLIESLGFRDVSNRGQMTSFIVGPTSDRHFTLA
jgi:FkbM family methyltransferase